MIQLSYISLKQALVACVLMVGAACAAYALTPTLDETVKPYDLEALIPQQFGGWHEQPNPYAQVGLVANPDDKSVEQPYDRILMRSYHSGHGEDVMLALAWAQEQTQDIKIHRPETCYKAQGFNIENKETATLSSIGGSPINIVRLMVSRGDRIEVVSYWIRVGDAFPLSALETRMKILRDGLAGKVDDGILVRASTIIEDRNGAKLAYQKQEKFLLDLAADPAVAKSQMLTPGI